MRDEYVGWGRARHGFIARCGARAAKGAQVHVTVARFEGGVYRVEECGGCVHAAPGHQQ